MAQEEAKKNAEKKSKKIADEISKLKVEKAGRITTVLKTEILDKKFLGKSVKAIRVYVTNHKDAQNIASEIKDMKGIEARREYDIPLISKYIMEKKVDPLRWHEVSGSNLGDNDFGGLIDSLDLKICILADKISLKKDAPVFKPKICPLGR